MFWLVKKLFPGIDGYDELTLSLVYVVFIFLPAALIFPVGVWLTLILLPGPGQLIRHFNTFTTSFKTAYFYPLVPFAVFYAFLVLPWNLNTAIAERALDTELGRAWLLPIIEAATALPLGTEAFLRIDSLL
ncbi:hypothetical protein [Citreimonas salinaria]|uniref:Uncharacterized protein n=1 Tax=Citreimonas salinaria TaxID=321339 RepID=A0A1H3N6N9_9RHOB|nr:hypothetical protein [Citreimonas salinaria]SDY84526.1 hypothetical protein SAMN05444340_1217 [Citreimonas salinaria]